MGNLSGDNGKRISVGVRITFDTFAQLTELAKGTTKISEIVRAALDEYLAKYQQIKK